MRDKYIKEGFGRNIPPASKYCIIYAGRNTHVAQILKEGLTPEQIEAHADLIAAAPKLLAACKTAFTLLDGEGIAPHTLRTLKEAIDSAEGTA